MPSESGKGEMLFAPIEKALDNLPENKPSKLEQLGSRVETAIFKLLRIHEVEEARDWQDKLKKISEKNPDKESKFKLASEMPKGVTSDVVTDFGLAFPKYAEIFENTPIKYLLGFSKLTNADMQNFMELLNEPGTMMGEAYPFYELITQKLSEKVASSHKGVWGKVFGVIAKITGWMTYKLDIPVLREWNNIEDHLNIKFGQKRTSEIIEDMYFGDKDKYQEFVNACKEARIDFPTSVEKAKKRSWYTEILHKRIMNNPKILANPIVAGGLNLPGKIYDAWVPTVIGTAIVGGAFVIGSSMGMTVDAASLYSGLGGIAAITGLGIGAGGVGIMFHEMTHVMGGNFRRKLQEINEKKIS